MEIDAYRREDRLASRQKQGAGREGAPTGGAATSSSVRSNILLLLRPNNLTLPDQREMGKNKHKYKLPLCSDNRRKKGKKKKVQHNTIRSVTPHVLQRLEVQWEAAAAGLGRQPSVTPPTKLLGAAPETNKRPNEQEKKKMTALRFLQYFSTSGKGGKKRERERKKSGMVASSISKGDCKWPPMANDHLSQLPELKTADFFFFFFQKSISRQKSLSDLTPILFTVQEAASCSATRKKKLQRSRTGAGRGGAGGSPSVADLDRLQPQGSNAKHTGHGGTALIKEPLQSEREYFCVSLQETHSGTTSCCRDRVVEASSESDLTKGDLLL